MSLEDDYLDVLQNIEMGIVYTYRDYPSMSDRDVIKVLSIIIEGYQEEQAGRTPREIDLPEIQNTLYTLLHSICEWRLGREVADNVDEVPLFPLTPTIMIEEVLLCLKRILKSVKRWHKRGGRKGYLHFIQKWM